jgi:hypothetical protein
MFLRTKNQGLHFSKWMLPVFLLIFNLLPYFVWAQSVTPPPPTGGSGSGTGGGNPDGPLDPLIPFDSTMNIVFLSLGVAFAIYVMIKRKKEAAVLNKAA